jgi:hypothetical protein
VSVDTAHSGLGIGADVGRTDGSNRPLPR